MPAIRTFIAVDLDPAVRRRLVELRRELSRADADVRWVREQGLHCTLKFLGGVEQEKLEQVHAALCTALMRVAAVSVQARGVGVFPNAQRPRVVWVGLEDEPTAPGGPAGSAERISALAAAVERALVPVGFAAEERPFRAHVTLGRVRGKSGWSRLAESMRERESEAFGATRVDRVVVYRSDLGSTGSTYTPLWTIGLAESSLATVSEAPQDGGDSGE
jgi:RNA 2',3'-cyclic 3'-phosphodiesterase